MELREYLEVQLDRSVEWVPMAYFLREVGVQVDPEYRQHIHLVPQVLGLSRSGLKYQPVAPKLIKKMVDPYPGMKDTES